MTESLKVPPTTSRPLVAHVVYRFDTGGLENGIVNLINHMPTSAYRHLVVALTEVVPGFARRIERDDVKFIALHKPPGHGAKLYPQLFRLFREQRPAIVHTRNLAALECQVPAALAGVPVRIHGEHGRDVGDLDGTRWRYQWLRRAYRPFVHKYVALSRDLAIGSAGACHPGHQCRAHARHECEQAHRPAQQVSGTPAPPGCACGRWPGAAPETA